MTHISASDEARITLEHALRVLQKDYWDDVRGIIEDCKDAIESGEIKTDEDLDRYLWETVDGCGRVIYTGEAMLGLRFSENDGAYLEEYGTDGAVENGQLNWSRLMFAALMADVREHPDFPTLEPEEEEDSE